VENDTLVIRVDPSLYSRGSGFKRTGAIGVRLSYSSVNTYETCPAKYKFQYETRLPTAPSPALSFGSSLHEALYRFHNRPVPVAPGLDELLTTLDLVWVSEGYSDASEEASYHQHGRSVLEQYHAANSGAFRIPAALEHKFRIEIEGVEFTGVIDRMDRIPGGGYEIIDYKTNRRLPTQSQVDQDLQLTVYHMAAREVWGIEAEALTLYYLLPGQRMTTTRTSEDADAVKRRIATVAERIDAGLFEPRENGLCNWCDFQEMCPIFRHRYEREGSDPAPKMTELVDEWIALKKQGRQVYRRIEELANLINAYCEEHDYRRLYGSDGDAIDRRIQHVTSPDMAKVRAILEPRGLWEQVLTVDPGKLNALIESRTLPPDVEDAILSSREEVRTQHQLWLKEASRSRR